MVLGTWYMELVLAFLLIWPTVQGALVTAEKEKSVGGRTLQINYNKV